MTGAPISDALASVGVKEGDVLAGKYRVERLLGAGGMGVVVSAMHLQLHQRVALKLMLPGAASSAEAVQRFVREARAAAQLRSDHVARVLDVGTLAEGPPFMVMELLLGSDLEELLRRHGTLSIRDAVDYVRQACDALQEAHQAGIVHRDMKPGNLFLATDVRGRTQIKVLDFGISKSMLPAGLSGPLALTRTSAVMGSPLYMSPEQMRASRNVDARTDIWSLGVTLYQLLVGQVPFLTESPMELGAKVLHEAPVPPDQLRPEISPALSAVVLCCLAKDPAQRFPTAQALADALEGTLAAVVEPARSAQTRAAETRVLVASATSDPSGALPYSHTALAHSRTTDGRRTRARSAVVLGVAVLAVGAGAVLLRVRAPEASMRVEPQASGDATLRGERELAPHVDPSGQGFNATPVTPVTPPAPVVTAAPVDTRDASAPAPAASLLRARPPAIVRTHPRATPPEAPPSATSNPLDHL